MTHTGTTAFLRQAHRNNWEQYLASLRPGALQDWDICVLTASDERQAEMYRRQLDWRREAGLLPHGMQTLVLPDPGGRRIGSGGATLNALAQVAGLVAECDEGRLETLQRVLLIHSGGDAKRLPHCSTAGKLFARVPRVLPDGRASTIFDEFLIGLSGLATQLPPGVLIASGDVLLVFDHLQLSGAFRRPGVIGVAAAVGAEMGHNHGVYVSGNGGHRVHAYLHKPSAAELTHWEAVSDDGTVQIDTGLVWLDAPTAEKFAALTQSPAVTGATLNLYGDLLMLLSGSTEFEQYLADTSDGPATLEVQATRRVIWERLRGTPFGVERLQPAVFVHFGSSHEYWHMTAGDPELADLCGWVAQVAAFTPFPVASGEGQGDPILINAAVDDSACPASENVGRAQGVPLIVDSHLHGPLTFAGPAIIAGVQTIAPLHIADEVVLHQMPIVGGGFVTRVFGLRDDPKQHWGVPGAALMNRPWDQWLSEAGVRPEQLWPHVAPEDRTLWHARLHPAALDREASLRLALPLQDPANAPVGWLADWLAAPRLSLAESAAQADGPRLLAELVTLEDTIAVQRFCAAVGAEQPAATAGALLGATSEAVRRRSQEAGSRLQAADPFLQMRGFKALAEATGSHAWEDRAFGVVADMVERSTRRLQRPNIDRREVQHVSARAAARIDFGGGWTDTPPHSIERGGTVLNAAVTLRGAHPIVAEVDRLPEPRLILVSRDLDTTLEPRLAGDVLAYANPADPFALHKAALVLRGVVPGNADPRQPLADLLRERGGLRVSTGTNIPFGSGLGTSSILAGVVLAALQALGSGSSAEQGRRGAGESGSAFAQLFDEVLCLEQMLTTGGGWQDQVGGLTGGVKLVTTPPGLPQKITVQPVPLTAAVAERFGERLLLVYTGQRRLAKNLLRAVMRRWMARDPEMIWIQGEIARLALAMRAALSAGALDEVGNLLTEHWALNKRIDPGCTNPFIDDLLDTLNPYVCGSKLAGAGGGGFVISIARSPEAAQTLSAVLAQRYPGTPVERWESAVPEIGLQVHTLS